ncbi:MAG: D-aminoacyl-tRNA deacylase [Actinomycetota bacterium]|nr:D-aminoacyl-tRNA deacylase [Actinomycetota bacterium]
MRAVVQRVTRAQVSVDRQPIASIGAGLCVLIAITHADTAATSTQMASKLWRMRIMADAAGAMNRSVGETGGEILVVSQFTLYGDTRRGRRPSWSAAARPEVAEPLVDAVVEELRRLGAAVATGRFGADMAVELVNDGPVTLIVEIAS